MQADPAIAAGAIVGPGEYRTPIDREQFDRRNAIAGQVGVRPDQLDVQATTRRVEAKVEIAIV